MLLEVQTFHGLLYHYKLAVQKDNQWISEKKLNLVLIRDFRELGASKFEFRLLEEYDNKVQDSHKLMWTIRKRVSQIAAERKSQYNLAWECEDRQSEKKRKSHHKKNSNVMKNQIGIEDVNANDAIDVEYHTTNGGRDNFAVNLNVDFNKLKTLDLEPENIEIDKIPYINILEGLDGGLRRVYIGAKLYDKRYNEFVIQDLCVSIKGPTGPCKLYSVSSFEKLLKNHDYVSQGALSKIKEKATNTKLNKYIEDMQKDGFSIKDIENKLKEIRREQENDEK